MRDQKLRVRVLGGAELTVNGRPLVELASAKAAALLFYLAVTGTTHSRSALAGLLWSDLPEPTARANLRLVLTKLRRVVPEHVAVTRQTIALTDSRQVWVDAAEVGRVAASHQDDGELLETVRLCRGDFLEGFSVPGAPLFDEWLTERRAAVRADMLALMDRAVHRARDRRDTAGGIEVTRRQLQLERLHEEAHRALMWFLAMGGQRSAALAQYDTCRYLLREELGIEPAAATIALRDEIAGTGGFTALGVLPPAAAGRENPATAAGSPTSDLPRPLTALIGREKELERLHELLDDPACRLVTLVGPGGIGKTRLAVEVAADRQPRHRDGTVFVSFVGTSPARPDEAADLVVADLARALEIELAVPRQPLDLLADQLAGRELLLVLDNLEHLHDAAGVLAELLRRAPGTQLLVTSRRQLGLGVEWLVEVPGLPYPPPGADADAAGYEAVQLFQERARLLRPGFPAIVDAEEVGRVCRLVAGVPLAIELAARWVRSASPAAIADRLADGLELLETTAPDVERRHRSLRAVIDWSCQLLTDEEHRTLRRLSVLRRSFDLAAASAVADAGLPMLASLVDQSLIAIGGDGRYEMHELLRQYAAESLSTDPAEEARTRWRHAEHYVALLPPPGEAHTEGGPSLEAEQENLRAATDWLILDADPTALDAHLVRLWALYRRLGWFREAQAFFGAALKRHEITNLQRARWHRMLGETHQQLGEANAARYHLERTLELLGGRVPASTTGRLGMLASQVARRTLRGLRPDGAVDRRADRREAAHERAATCFTIAEVYWVLDEQFPILLASSSSLHDAQRAGDLDLIVRAQAGLGMIVGTLGLHRLAGRHLRAASAAVERTTDPLTACWVGIVGGLHWTGVGDWAAVDLGADRVLKLRRQTPMHRWADEVLLITAVARYLTARYSQAAAAAAEGMASGRDRHDPVVHLWGLLLLIETALRANPDDPALAGWSEEAAPLLPAAARIDAARLHAATARQHLAAGRPADAWQAIRAADHLMGPHPSFEQYALEAHAGVLEVCLTLLELAGPRGSSARGAGGPDPVDLSATTAAALRRLDRYARTFAMARPRSLICLGWYRWLDGRAGAAMRAWVRAVREAERRQMPYELARAHHELGRHLAAGQRSALGLNRAEHLERAIAGFEIAGCRGDLRRVQALAGLTVS
ncbi:BTAD domain-containing putative transcriptional regulator [Micromonospora sp. NPDC005173]|uniref:AfsR/SARP family transcriptional regulator n=1 Tax=Micromonospora sp. NPDC005173 TaxID=3157165 RepID=UPI0033BDD1B1